MTLLQQAIEALEGADSIDTDMAAAITALRKAIEAGMVVQQGWRPISEAPKDFITDVDLWTDGVRVPDCIWAKPDGASKCDYDWCMSEYENGYGWAMKRVNKPTHWMPLPPAPTQEDGK